MISARSRMSSPAAATILAVSLLQQHLLLSHPTSAFLTPVNVRATSARSITSSDGTASPSWRRKCSPDDTSAAQGEPEAIRETLDAGDTEGMVKSPAGLTLEDVYKRLKLDVQGLDDGVVGLESRDVDYGVEIVKVKVPRVPSLGMQLEEVARGGDGRGLVLVAGMEPGGNAEATGKIAIGDTISWVGIEPDRMKRVEALDWDQTVGALGEFSGETEIMVVLKRLVKRENVHVVFALPDGNQEYDIKAGSNLRGEMIRLGVPVYDPKTLRYDQPYATGNCAGEGICGTCFVEVQEGAELLSPADEEENMLMAKGGLPARWRLACKTIVGRENVAGRVCVKAVPQTEWRARRGGK